MVANADEQHGDAVGDQRVLQEIQNSLQAVLRRSAELGSGDLQSSLHAFQNQLQVALLGLESQATGPAGETTEESEAASQLLGLIFRADVPKKLIGYLGLLEFEHRKDATRAVGMISRLSTAVDGGAQVTEYMRNHPDLVELLLEGCGRTDVFMHCAQMLERFARNPLLVTLLLDAQASMKLIDLAQHPNFDIASEAFNSLRTLLMTQKSVSAAYLKRDFVDFFAHLHSLLQTDVYVTKRQALRLLGEVLLSRSFMSVVVDYVSNDAFLPIHMNLLRDDSKAIQIEAFHILKIFVANPDKPRRVALILHRNRERLKDVFQSLSGVRKTDKALLEDVRAATKLLDKLEASIKRPLAVDATQPAVVEVAA
mmetsp:Transcript_18506/g.50809  ORF Transcript_18506/g.50809 Transcript_18506/m.50809 type:complete len:368 (+) Transcript_18506:90-1193(+)|eukprot:CAMPEP_0117507634 /NCGR_PEP_ID=MMETSP0784-20121206/26525_1 /TAXON_ID=39447 /ORGANISM="" /LENGTH=367 /DNA_ID=CAMNT_0005303145 /DNA_START=83 /DNA_END=1186 /DNA_ORIENTATION=+